MMQCELVIEVLGLLHTMAKGREAVDFHRLDCKKSRIRSLDSHTRGQSSKAIALQNAYMASLSDQCDGLYKEDWADMNENPKLWSRGRRIFFHKKTQKLVRPWPLDWRVCFGQGVEWDVPSSFGLWAWPLEASHYGRLS
jgi:hypothetical protein